jgi:hypothetical protein
VWIPSRIYQEIRWLENGWIERTHIDNPDLDPDSRAAYLGGAEAVCLALAELAKVYPEADIAFIGGRPPSMAKLFPEVKHLTESSVMGAYLQKQLDQPHEILYPFDVTDSCNTGTDMRDLAAIAEQYEHTTLIGMGFRLPRCRGLFREYLQGAGLEHLEQRVAFRDAEQFLPSMFDEFVSMNRSKGYENVMSQERFGLKKLGLVA